MKKLTQKLFNLLEKLGNIGNENSKKIIVFGGWAVELNIGKRFRDHENLDLVFLEEDFDWWKNQLQDLGFVISNYLKEEGMNDKFSFIAKKEDLIIDAAAIRIEENGNLTWIDEKEEVKIDKKFDEYYREIGLENYSVWIVRKEILLQSKKNSNREKDILDYKGLIKIK